jgi:hypothetical protein
MDDPGLFGAAAPAAPVPLEPPPVGNRFIDRMGGETELYDELEYAARDLGFTCPITQTIFENPVETQPDSEPRRARRYEKYAITNWVQNKRSNPSTRQRLSVANIKELKDSAGGRAFLKKLNAFKNAAIDAKNKGKSNAEIVVAAKNAARSA